MENAAAVAVRQMKMAVTGVGADPSMLERVQREERADAVLDRVLPPPARAAR